MAGGFQKSLNPRQLYYITVHDQCTSPCNNYLAVSTNYGWIFIFNIHNFLNSEVIINNEVDCRKSITSFKAHSSSIYTMASTDEYLISASSFEIKAWSWEDIISKAISEPSWSIIVPKDNHEVTKSGINCITVKKLNQWMLYVACGDKIHVFDLETKKELVTIGGHSDYIHQLIATSNGNEVISCSEDGSVRIWDIQQNDSEIHILEPYKNSKLCRPNIGKWIGCISLDTNEDWLLMGGGPILSSWHLPTKSFTRAFQSVPDFAAQQALYYGDTVIAAGTTPKIYQWCFNGESKAEVQTEASSIYSLNIVKHPEKNILTCGGASSKLAVCKTDFLYKDFSLILS